MKKLLSLVLCVALMVSLSVAAFAESKEEKIDLSGMTFDELVALKDQINLAIWACDEWQEVEVPIGVWKVGDDIPAGHWTIHASDGNDCFVYVGSKLKNGGADVDWKTHQRVVSESCSYYKDSKYISEWTIELSEGQYVQAESAAVVFTPYAGKPSLGFKK